MAEAQTFKVCESGIYDPPRCRKRATVAVIYARLFGHRVNMMGPDIPVYIRDVTLRCPVHGDERVVRTEGLLYDRDRSLVNIVGISDYLTAVAQHRAEEEAARG